MAIASADDLRNFFGLPDDVAKRIANIPRTNVLGGSKVINTSSRELLTRDQTQELLIKHSNRKPVL